ncbi:uncharacterized protein LOC135837336 [Planococcus citri]|uniref:uncharacterized protein LOC135837336 n=1 Tax=Planococcus citri TaxID=170843 RepID=UPI0031F8ACC3
MYFYSTVKILFLILIRVKDIFSTQEICLENDITIHLNEMITNISAIECKIADEMIYTIPDYILKEFEYNISNDVQSFQTNFFLQDIKFSTGSVRDEDDKTSQIVWKFHENKLSVTFKEPCIKLNGVTKVNGFQDEKSSTFYLGSQCFGNFTITATRSHIKDEVLNNSYEITYSSLEYYYGDSWDKKNLTNEGKEQLKQELRSVLLAALHKNLNNNQNFSREFDKLFHLHEIRRKEIISIHSDFVDSEQSYYYLIPKIPFLCFILKRIVIYGLSNFESYAVRRTPENFKRTLLVRNLRGSMTLDYRTENEPDLELDFQIDCLILSRRQEADCIHAQAKYYTVTRTKTNVTLSSHQSEVMMNRLESAIASALSSSKKVAKFCDLEMPLEKINVSKDSNWSTIKESYKKWIPFNDDEIVNKGPSEYVKIMC